MATKKKKRRWPVLLWIVLVILALAWFFRPFIERKLRERQKPAMSKEKVQEQIREDERKKLDEILKRK